MKLYSNEIVFRGHPDKVCDQISDAILDECLKQDKNSRCAVEVMGGKGKIFITGEVTSNSKVDIERIVNFVLKDVGYNEKYEIIAPANTMKDNYSRKQKIKQKSQDYRRPQGAKRETEADKIRRMQLERIKKTPITVTVGEEITVGELAAALKKTAAKCFGLDALANDLYNLVADEKNNENQMLIV